jgi:hypothetical protein
MQLQEHAVPGQIAAQECRIRARAVEANHAGWAISAERLRERQEAAGNGLKR